MAQVFATAPFQGSENNIRFALNCDWDVGTLEWIKSTGGSGGGPVTIADGADVAQGSRADAAWVSGNGTVISLLKKIASPSGGGLTDTELRASAVPVTANAGTNLNTSALATSAKQDILLAAVDGVEALLTDVIAFETTTNLGSGAVYSSGLLQLSPGYSQVFTNILSDRTGTLSILWYSDAGGTDLVRTLTIAYTAGDGFLTFGAPAFTRSVKYEFTNSVGGSTTDFYFTTKFLPKAVSPQVITLSAPVASGMTANLTRSVLVGLSSAGGGTFVNVKVNPSGTLEVNATPVASATATQSAVADSATSVTILASNSARLGASVANDSTVTLYLRLSATAATTTAYTVAVVANAYYEVPFRYTGAITGIWASDPNTGAARVTEFTA